MTRGVTGEAYRVNPSARVLTSTQLHAGRRTVYAHVRNSREKTGTASALQLATQAARESVGEK